MTFDETTRSSTDFLYIVSSEVLRFALPSNPPAPATTAAEKARFQRVAPLLRFFLKTPPLQMLLVYALQVICHEQSFPEGIQSRADSTKTQHNTTLTFHTYTT